MELLDKEDPSKSKAELLTTGRVHLFSDSKIINTRICHRSCKNKCGEINDLRMNLVKVQKI